MTTEDGGLSVTFNGEIYNFRELRSVLEKKGKTFRTESDTEVVLRSYEVWGGGCVERFRGMFAFAIADWRRRELFLARDHFGIKPLIYTRQGSWFAFASEIQALRGIPGGNWEVDLHALDQYLTLKYIASPRTIFRHVSKLPPAHRLTIGFDGRTAGPEEYWNLEFRPARRRHGDWLEELQSVLMESVGAHLVADVPFGAFLSGGVDSSLMVACMSRILGPDVRTFSIGFEDPEYSELPFANIAAKQYGTQHYTEIVRPDAVDLLPKLVRHYGEPFADSSAVPTYYASRLARAQVPMVISGDGGDELFAGYDAYSEWMNWLHYGGVSPLRRWLHGIKHAVRHRTMRSRVPSVDAWFRCKGYGDYLNRAQLWRPEFRGGLAAPFESFESAMARPGNFSMCHRAQYVDFKTYLPDDVLVKVDVASMMHGLEVRTPLIDRRVVEFAATIPEQIVIRLDEERRWIGKRLLKELASRWYSPEFACRRKQGFAVPIDKWCAVPGRFREFAYGRLSAPDSPLWNYFELRAVRQQLEREGSGSVWTFLFLDEWMRQNET